MAEPTPSVSALADALARTAPPPAQPRVAIARPTPVVRVLIAAILVLTLLFVAALLVLGARVSTLMVEVRLDRDDREHRQRLALPAEAVLREHEATRRAVLARPLAAGPIWQARCELLARAGAWQAIDDTCVQVGLANPDDLSQASRLLHAEALHRLGRHGEAGRVLHAIEQTRLDQAGRQRAADLAGRLWLVERPAEQVGQPAPEGADQLDAR